jgi:hypothetical protein
MKTKLFFSILIFNILVYNLTNAQTFQAQQNIGKAFMVEPGSNFIIENKYGDITVETHTGNELRIDVVILVKSDDSLQTKKMLDYVHINMTKNGAFIKAETQITQTNAIIDLFKILEASMPSSNIKVDYTINMPTFVNINISNNYGDVYLGNISSQVSIQLKNGSLYFGKILGNNNTISVTNGKVQGDEIKKASLNMQFCPMVKITSANELKIESISSQFNISDVNTLNINSRRDKWFVENNMELFGNSFMSDFQIDLLKNRISLISNYGILEIKNLKNTFNLINLNTNYTKIDVFVPMGSDFAFDFTGENAELLNPFDEKQLTRSVLDQSKKIIQIKGNIGSTESKSIVKIKAKNAAVNLYYN